MRSRRGKLTLRLLILLLFVFSSSTAYIIFTLLTRSEDLSPPRLENLYWTVSQIERETLRFLLTLERFGAGDETVTADDVQLRYNILLSRFDILGAGQMAERFFRVEGGTETVTRLKKLALDLEPAVFSLKRDDRTAARRIIAEFEAIGAEIGRVAVDTMLFEDARYNAVLNYEQATYWRLSYFIVGVGLSGFVLIALMFRGIRVSESLQEAADRAQKQLRDAIESLSDAFRLFDGDGRLVIWNRRYKELALNPECIRAGVTFEEIVRSEAREVLGDCSNDQIEAYVKRRIERCGSPKSESIELRRKDGIWLRISDRRATDGSRVGIITDITDLKEREFHLATQSSLLQATLDNMGEGIAVFDGELRLVVWNRLFFEMMGIPSCLGAAGTSLNDISAASFWSQCGVSGAWPDAILHGTLDRAVVSRRDGAIIHMRRNPMPDGGFVVLCTDVTAQREAEARLRKSEASLANAQRISGLGNWDWDVETGEIYCSEQVYRIFGTKPVANRMPYRMFLNAVHHADRKMIERLIRGPGNDRHAYSIVHRIVRPDGEERVVRHIGEFVRDANGNPIRASGIIQDITAQHAAEKALLDSEERYRTLVDSLKDVVFATDLCGKWTFLNSAWEQLTGRPTQESLAKNAVSFFSSDDRRALSENLERLRSGSIKSVQLMASLITASGERVRVDVSLRQKLDKEGRIIGTTGLIRNVEARERIVEAERESALLSAIINTAGALVAAYDSKGRLLRSNAPFRALLVEAGMEKTESTFLWDLASEQEDVQADRGLFSPLDSSQFPRSFEGTVKMRDGSRRIIQWTATALTDIGGSVRMVIVIGIDNTERWRTELALYQASKLTTLGEMATAMAHELNQPLNVISLAAENLMVKLQRGTADEDFIANKVVRITSQVDRAAKIINHMRIFGRQPDGGFVPIDPRKSVENALDLLGQTLKISGIKVTARMAEECPPVLGHATLLEQVVINLLNNAHDAILAHVPDICPACGGRAIDLEVAYDAKSGQVVISVQDTGGGIPDAALSRLFDPFFTTKPVGKGTGLGLSVSFGIINDMKGRIEAENRNGGARFTIYLPCIATAGAEAESVMA